MEFMAFKKCMDELIGWDLLISTFISDRHKSISSHMKKVLTHVTHYFDIWHLKKSMLVNFKQYWLSFKSVVFYL